MNYAEAKMHAARERADTRAEQYWRHVIQASGARQKPDLYIVLSTTRSLALMRETVVTQELPRRIRRTR